MRNFPHYASNVQKHNHSKEKTALLMNKFFNSYNVDKEISAFCYITQATKINCDYTARLSAMKLNTAKFSKIKPNI